MVCTKSLKGQPIEALDGLIGHVCDLYFDDSAWKVRYLVVKTGSWLFGRKVLIVPDALAEKWHGESGVPVNLTKDEVRSRVLVQMFERRTLLQMVVGSRLRSE